ncbi:MAG: DUF4259 domain-containing protein [Methylacidiphilales bacterium]|nr:DUF4259 domain-containing protein [Candidatus Methylacidiphilales bacterium]
MGAWNFGPFDNDDAGDWLYELEKSSDTSAIADALHRVTDIGDEYLEAPDCSSAIAAAEIIAALHGQPVAKFPDNAKQWVDTHGTLNAAALVPTALAALQRIRTNSELKELWDESDDAPKWYATIDDLAKRLNT